MIPSVDKVTNPALSTGLQGMSGIQFFQSFLPSLVTLILILGSVIAFFIFLLGGIQWMVAGGDKASMETARGRISAGIIGLVILFSVFALVKIIELFFNIDILTIDILNLAIQ